jgi:NAD(P)-dependent dehydrogenase (short-subunit alcohol dehydrogenase family)
MSAPSPTKTWHTDTYSSISPTRPELSAAGKRIVITGGGYGIGRELTKTYAQAGASEIAILGRSEGPLLETKKIVTEQFPNTKVTHFIADVTDSVAVKKAADAFGQWNILLLNAGYMPDAALVRDAKIDDYWSGYEINVKGTIVTLQSFLPTKGADATVVATSTAGILFPKAMSIKYTAYVASKQAVTSFIEYVAAEEPDVHFVTIHPGVIQTQMFDKFANPNLVPDTSKYFHHR